MDIREELLEAWIELSSLIWSNRILKELTYHEATILRELKKRDGKPINATELSKKSGMKKPQMHRILRSMEDRGLIRREINPKDRRSQHIWMNPVASEYYQRDHVRVLALLEKVVAEAGEERTKKFIANAKEMAKVYHNVQDELSLED